SCPAARNDSASVSTLGASRPPTTTRAPRAARPRAIAWPRPPEPPGTNATLPSSVYGSVEMQPSVHVDNLASDETGERRGQEHDGMRHFFGLAEASDRDAAQQLVTLRLRELLGDHLRLHVGR